MWFIMTNNCRNAHYVMIQAIDHRQFKKPPLMDPYAFECHFRDRWVLFFELPPGRLSNPTTMLKLAHSFLPFQKADCLACHQMHDLWKDTIAGVTLFMKLHHDQAKANGMLAVPKRNLECSKAGNAHSAAAHASGQHRDRAGQYQKDATIKR